MNKSHSFNTELAKIIGLKESIILSHLYFWFEQNRSNGKNFYDGTWWTYNSIKTFSKQFEYLSEKEIRGALKRLNELGYTIEGCYNKIAIDKTKWYSLTEKALQLFEKSTIIQKGESTTQKGKRDIQNGKAIPYTNTDVNTINTNTPLSPKGEESSFEEIGLSINEWIEAYLRTCKRFGVQRSMADINKTYLERKLNKWRQEGLDNKKPLHALYAILGDKWEREHRYPSANLPNLFNLDTIARWCNRIESKC